MHVTDVPPKKLRREKNYFQTTKERANVHRSCRVTAVSTDKSYESATVSAHAVCGGAVEAREKCSREVCCLRRTLSLARTEGMTVMHYSQSAHKSISLATIEKLHFGLRQTRVEPRCYHPVE